MNGLPGKNAVVNLRRRAEALLAEGHESLDRYDRKKLEELIHELQVRDVELQLQTEELAATQAQLEATRDRYRDLYHTAPVGYFTLDDEGQIVDVNLTGAVLLGLSREELIGTLLARWVAREDQRAYYFFHQQLLEETRMLSQEMRMIRSDRSRFYGSLQGIVTRSETGGSLCRITLSDVTEQRQRYLIELLLAQSSQQMMSGFYMDHLLNLLVAAVPETLPSAQLAFLWLYDQKEKTLITRAWSGLDGRAMPQLKVPLHDGIAGLVFRSGQPQIFDDLSRVPGFDNLRCATLEPARTAMGVPLISDKRVVGVLMAYSYSRTKIFSERDLLLLEALGTQIILALQNARLFDVVSSTREQLRHLTRQLVSAQEAERRRIAHELHDEAGQALTMLKLELQTLRRALGTEGLAEHLQSSIGLVDETAEQIRRLSYALRPPMLDTMELNRVLQSYSEDFASRTALPVNYQGMTLPELPEETRITLYRFLQEALTNVARHAQAKGVTVRIQRAAGEIAVSVKDDGAGFDPRAQAEIQQPHGLGLLGIRERLEALGGHLEIISAIGEGTCLIAHIPYQEAAS